MILIFFVLSISSAKKNEFLDDKNKKETFGWLCWYSSQIYENGARVWIFIQCRERDIFWRVKSSLFVGKIIPLIIHLFIRFNVPFLINRPFLLLKAGIVYLFVRKYFITTNKNKYSDQLVNVPRGVTDFTKYQPRKLFNSADNSARFPNLCPHIITPLKDTFKPP